MSSVVAGDGALGSGGLAADILDPNTLGVISPGASAPGQAAMAGQTATGGANGQNDPLAAGGPAAGDSFAALLAGAQAEPDLTAGVSAGAGQSTALTASAKAAVKAPPTSPIDPAQALAASLAAAAGLQQESTAAAAASDKALAKAADKAGKTGDAQTSQAVDPAAGADPIQDQTLASGVDAPAAIIASLATPAAPAPVQTSVAPTDAAPGPAGQVSHAATITPQPAVPATTGSPDPATAAALPIGADTAPAGDQASQLAAGSTATSAESAQDLATGLPTALSPAATTPDAVLAQAASAPSPRSSRVQSDAVPLPAAAPSTAPPASAADAAPPPADSAPGADALALGTPSTPLSGDAQPVTVAEAGAAASLDVQAETQPLARSTGQSAAQSAGANLKVAAATGVSSKPAGAAPASAASGAASNGSSAASSSAADPAGSGPADPAPGADPAPQAVPDPTAALAVANAPIQVPTINTARVGPETVSRLASQIVQTAQGPASEFNLTLHPAELGGVQVKIQIGRDGQVRAALRFDNAQSAADLGAQADDLRAQLSQAGFDVAGDGLSFSLNGQGRQAQDDNDTQSGLMGGRAFRAAVAGAEDLLTQVNEAASRLSRASSAGGLDIRI